MLSPGLPEPELLKEILEPLLEDFQYWFGRTRSLLETETLSFLTPEQQTEQLTRVVQAQEEVRAAQSLFRLMEGQVGLEPAVLMTWHQQVTVCWQLLMQWRLSKGGGNDPQV
jgi:hypothetical protein